MKLSPFSLYPALVATLLLASLTEAASQNATKASTKPSAQAPSASAIVGFGERQISGITRQAQLLLLVHRRDSERQLKVRSWSVAGKHTLLEITNPTKEERVTSLWTNDQIWNYLPRTDHVVRASSSVMSRDWMGTQLTYEDMMGSGSLAKDYRHKIVRQERFGDDKVIVIDCARKAKTASWARVRYWARARDWMPVKEEFYDESGTLIRTLRYGRYGHADGRVMPGLVLAKRAEAPDEWTVMLFQKVLFNRALNPSLFQKDRLRATAKSSRIFLRGWSEQRLDVGTMHTAGAKSSSPKRVLVSRK